MMSPEFVALQEAVMGRYSLDRELGRGGMGVVYLARDVALDRLVAIKLLPPSLADDRAVRNRFLREARTAAGLSHPHIVPIHAVEEVGEIVYFVMGFVSGHTLGQRVRTAGPLDVESVMRVTLEVAWALAHAHARGVVHRDVKPDNILIDGDSGRAMVTDFGIAQVAAHDTPSAGLVVGTPQYMSPEQAAGTVDERSDVYSLGVTAFLGATGRLPFESETATGYLTKHAGEPAPKLGPIAPRLPPRFAAAVDRCLAKNPQDRFQSAEDLAAEVAACRGALVRVPAPLERFTREARAIGQEAFGYLVGSVGIVAALEIVAFIDGDLFGIVRAIEVLMVTVFVGLAAARGMQLIAHVRQLIAAGYQHPALSAAITAEQRRVEETEDRGWRGTAFTALAGAAATALGVWGATGSADPLVVGGVALSIAAPLVTGRRLWERLGGVKLFNKLLTGKWAARKFKWLGLGLSKRAPALPADGEHTELALGRAIEELYDALPAADREQLGDVPALIAKLEADALALRTQSHEPVAADRLATTVAALEALRLDLLRLRAGQKTLDELTTDVEAVRKVGLEIDAQLAARAEVERID